MSNNLYMPLYIGDYLTDAAHLTVSEHGAYLLLIMNYWQRGEALPADDRKLAGIAKMSRDEWSECRDLIREFFEERDGLLHHGRIDSELLKAKEKSAKARGSANARHANAKSETCERNANAQRPQTEGNALKDKEEVKEEREETTPGGVVVRGPAPKPPKAPRSKPKTSIDPHLKPTTDDARVAQEHGMSAADMVREWPQFKNYHISKDSKMADWSAAWGTWCGNFQKFKQARGSPRQPVGSLMAQVANGTYRGNGDEYDSSEYQSGQTSRSTEPPRRGSDRALPEPGGDDSAGPLLDLRVAGASWG